MRIVTIGEILIDLTQTGYNQQNIPMYAANPGGAPANVAVAASRLGADTAFVGMVAPTASAPTCPRSWRKTTSAPRACGWARVPPPWRWCR